MLLLIILHKLLFTQISTAPGPTCQHYTGTLCRHVGTIALDYIYINTSIASQPEYERFMSEELKYLNLHAVTSKCQEAMTDLLCRTNFPLCDKSSSFPTQRTVSIIIKSETQQANNVP